MKVENIKEIPFDSFKQLKSSVKNGPFSLGARRDLATNLVNKLNSTSFILTFLLLLPYLLILAYISYIVVTGAWWLFFIIPVFVIGYYFLLPSTALVFGRFRGLLICLCFLGAVLGFFYRIDWLWIACVIQVINWLSIKRIYRSAVDVVVKKALESEDMFCSLWNEGIISIHNRDGSSFFKDFKQLADGKIVGYEDEETSSDIDRPSDKEIKEFLDSNSDFFEKLLRSQIDYWREIVNISNSIKDENGSKVDESLKSVRSRPIPASGFLLFPGQS